MAYNVFFSPNRPLPCFTPKSRWVSISPVQGVPDKIAESRRPMGSEHNHLGTTVPGVQKPGSTGSMDPPASTNGLTQSESCGKIPRCQSFALQWRVSSPRFANASISPVVSLQKFGEDCWITSCFFTKICWHYKTL